MSEEKIIDFNSLTTVEKIKMITESLYDLISYKNKMYGDSALKPANVFSKLNATDSICIRLDDKIKRIQNCKELRVNDLIDICGYIILLLASMNALDFSEFKD